MAKRVRHEEEEEDEEEPTEFDVKPFVRKLADNSERAELLEIMNYQWKEYSAFEKEYERVMEMHPTKRFADKPAATRERANKLTRSMKEINEAKNKLMKEFYTKHEGKEYGTKMESVECPEEMECFEFVFDRIKPKSTDFDNFAAFLKKNEYHVVPVDSSVQKDDIVLYLQLGALDSSYNYPETPFEHIGIVEEGGKILSKYGAGPVYVHDVSDVPASYGSHVLYIRK